MALGFWLDYVDFVLPLAWSKNCPCILHYKIMEDSTFFDHHPISLLINLSTNPPRRSSWKPNARFLQEAKDLFKPLCMGSVPFPKASLKWLWLGWKRIDLENLLIFGKFWFIMTCKMKLINSPSRIVGNNYKVNYRKEDTCRIWSHTWLMDAIRRCDE